MFSSCKNPGFSEIEKHRIVTSILTSICLIKLTFVLIFLNYMGSCAGDVNLSVRGFRQRKK